MKNAPHKVISANNVFNPTKGPNIVQDIQFESLTLGGYRPPSCASGEQRWSRRHLEPPETAAHSDPCKTRRVQTGLCSNTTQIVGLPSIHNSATGRAHLTSASVSSFVTIKILTKLIFKWKKKCLVDELIRKGPNTQCQLLIFNSRTILPFIQYYTY